MRAAYQTTGRFGIVGACPGSSPLPSPPTATRCPTRCSPASWAATRRSCKAFGRLDTTIRFKGRLPVELKEAVRRATAGGVGCEYCASLGSPKDSYEDRASSVAVGFAQMVADDPKGISDGMFDVLREEFDEEEIVELVAWTCLVAIAGQMFGARHGARGRVARTRPRPIRPRWLGARAPLSRAASARRRRSPARRRATSRPSAPRRGTRASSRVANTGIRYMNGVAAFTASVRRPLNHSR